MKKWSFSSEHLIPLSFLGAILIGTLLLLLPIASASGNTTDFLTAFFTATTSVCVTGLVVVDTYSHWSIFGQVVIMILAQIGGLGIITVASLFMLFTRKKISMGQRIMLTDALNLNERSGVLRILVRIIRGTIIVELLGAIIYSISFIPLLGYKKGIWAAIFNSVSAFCNAGMDVVGPTSMGIFNSNSLVLFTTMTLIVLGGLGYVVWFDLSAGILDGIKKRYSPKIIWKRLSEHTKLVLSLTGILITVGTLSFLLFEYNNAGTIGNMPLPQKILNSLFESVTLRTAGFASFSQKSMTDVSCIMAYILMFIGGSPVGTAGGVKTVTFFLATLNILSYINDDDKTLVFNRNVSYDLMRKSTVILAVSSFTVIVFTLLLMATDSSLPFADALFEIVSASATVGLSRDVTSTLNPAGRIIVIISMYLGRIGPISMAIFFAKRKNKKSSVKYIEGNFYVG
ncbi:trk system potassium uptake protein TrkH [Butyrivibrio proteoclasticus]|uniref:Trk system potassium uptake protein TrkH n=1 Tax=Butyrivibrio proteoclasticus TaxID=43305 RepID=A0A1I5X6U2_9FIRM|nr:potassium transporter TrkG [Butyrivibrio proteoclasticus]SFQ27367.1 trk system potassium uptake protein TrkH [Butyrivibrio proteoclasticus]